MEKKKKVLAVSSFFFFQLDNNIYSLLLCLHFPCGDCENGKGHRTESQ